jgi:hypothetical protein
LLAVDAADVVAWLKVLGRGDVDHIANLIVTSDPSMLLVAVGCSFCRTCLTEWPWLPVRPGSKHLGPRRRSAGVGAIAHIGISRAPSSSQRRFWMPDPGALGRATSRRMGGRSHARSEL